MRTDKMTGYPSVDKVHQREWTFLEHHPLIPSLSIWDVFCLMTSGYRDDTVVECRGLTVSYRELKQDVRCLSAGLLEAGIKKNDIIVADMPNMYHGLLLFFAANRIGAAVTFLNCFTEDGEIRKYLQLYHSPLLFVYGWTEKRCRAVIRETKVRHVIMLDEKDGQARPTLYTKAMRDKSGFCIPFAELCAVDPGTRHRMPMPCGRTAALILYTSGTTGQPKPVVLSNRNIIAEAIYMKNSSHIAEVRGEKSLACVPFTYPYGFVTSVLLPILCGRTVILAPELLAEDIVSCMNQKPNLIFGSPAFLELMKRSVPEDMDLSSVHTFITGGDYMTVSQERAGVGWFAGHGAAAVICNGSGNAETCGGNTNIVGVQPREGTVGKPLTGMQAIVLDENNQELRYGEEGQLCLAGANVFERYYEDKEKTKSAKIWFKGKQYFKTGSVGYLDEEGYFTLTNRLSRFFITISLNKVYCDYVQNVMGEIEMIKAAAVVRKSDADNIYVGMAFVVLKDGVEASEDMKRQIWERCRHEISIAGHAVRLKEYEIPKFICFVEDLPRTLAGKIDYPVLEGWAEDGKGIGMIS